MRGRPATGSMRRKICGGLNTRSKRLKRGVKSVIAQRIALRIAHGGLHDGRVAHVGRPRTRPSPSITTSQKPFSSSPATSRENTGSESKRGKHHHTMRADRFSRAAIRQLPITARSRPPSVGVAGLPTRRLVCMSAPLLAACPEMVAHPCNATWGVCGSGGNSAMRRPGLADRLIPAGCARGPDRCHRRQPRREPIAPPSPPGTRTRA